MTLLYSTCLLILVSTISSYSLQPQLPSYSRAYELRRPLRYAYYRMNIKAEYNPLLYHFLRDQSECSSKMGPYCLLLNDQQFQQFALESSSFTKVQSQASKKEKAYLPYYWKTTVEIEKGLGVFLVPSPDYRIIDNAVQETIQQIMYSEEIITIDSSSTTDNHQSQKKKAK